MRFGSHPVEVLLFVLLWTTYAYFYQGMGDNEAVRIDQLRALVENHTFRIDKYFWNTADIVFYPPRPQPGSVYSSKAPGQAFLLAPVYAVVRVGLMPLRWLGVPEWVYWHLLTYLLTLCTAGLCSALAAVVTYRILLELTADRAVSVLAVVAVWLGTLLFPFATMFFSHAITAALLVFAFFILFQLRLSDGVRTRARVSRVFLTGMCLSVTAAGEYPALLPAGLLALYGMWIGWRWTISRQDKFFYLGAFGIGLSAGVVLLIGYNYAVFGKPFYIAYETYSEPGTYFHATHARGWIGLHGSSIQEFFRALAGILIFPPIGLVYIKFERWGLYANNPVLWLALPGLVLMVWRRRWRPEGLLIGAMVGAYLLFLGNFGSSAFDWSGGSFLGPRHLVPLLPFLALPLGFAIGRLRLIFYPLLALSVFYMLVATAVEPRVPFPFGVPARDQLLPDYLHGKLAQNNHRLFDSGQHLLTRDSTAFNLAKLGGVRGDAQLVPLMLWWVILGGGLLFVVCERPMAAGVGTAIIFAFASAVASAPIIHRALTAPKVTGHGLLGKYYRNATWSGPPVKVQIDSAVDFDWSGQMPLPPPFSVEWSGQLLVEQPGAYEFAIKADDGALVEIDGRIVADASNVLLQEKTGRMELSAGLHRIRVRYFNKLFGGSVHLWWTLTGRPKQVVPVEALVPQTMTAMPARF